jgi:hypothetical protein
MSAQAITVLCTVLTLVGTIVVSIVAWFVNRARNEVRTDGRVEQLTAQIGAVAQDLERLTVIVEKGFERVAEELKQLAVAGGNFEGRVSALERFQERVERKG